MKQAHCNFEEKITQASRSGNWSDVLLAHVADCRSCEEIVLVAGFLCESSEAERASAAALPDAGRIWWKAQLAAKADALERALRPIVWARRFAFGLCAAAFFVSIITWWTRLGAFFGSFVESWTGHRAASAPHNSALFFVTALFLLILIPVIFGLYTAWSED